MGESKSRGAIESALAAAKAPPCSGQAACGASPAGTGIDTAGQPDDAKNPVCRQTRTISTPASAGTVNCLASFSREAAFDTNALQTGEATRPPVMRSPSGLWSSFPA